MIREEGQIKTSESRIGTSTVNVSFFGKETNPNSKNENLSMEGPENIANNYKTQLAQSNAWDASQTPLKRGRHLEKKN